MTSKMILGQIVSSFDKIQSIIHMLHGRFINSSTIIVAKLFEPVYDELLADLIISRLVHGDETGRYLDGMRYWACGCLPQKTSWHVVCRLFVEAWLQNMFCKILKECYALTLGMHEIMWA